MMSRRQLDRATESRCSRTGRTSPYPTLLAVFSLLALAGMTGCVVGPDYQPPESRVPDEWTQSTGETTVAGTDGIDEWWTLLGDPLLDDLIQRAVQSNLNLQIARARVREARAMRTMASADLWPHVGMTGSYAYEGRSLNKRAPGSSESLGDKLRRTVSQELGNNAFKSDVEPQDFAADVAGDLLGDSLPSRVTSGNARPRAQNLFEFGFDASWELDLFGGVRRSIESAEAEAEAAAEDYRDVLVTLLSEVARNYVEARGYQEQLAIAHQNIEAHEKILRLTKLQRDGGIGSELDVLQAQAQLSSMRSELAILETAQRQAVHRLSLLLGELPDATLAELSEEVPIPITPPTIPLGLPSDLLRRRPDIRRSERLLAAATARIGVATADLFPKFSLNASLGSETYDVGRVLDSRSLAWSLGPSIEWPIADAGRIRANIEAQESRQEQALAQYNLDVLNAIKEVEDALIAYKNEHVRYCHLDDAAGANRQAVSIATAQYNEGLSGFLVVLDSSRSLYKTQRQLVQSRMNTTLHVIAIFKALGGGWIRHEPSEHTIPNEPPRQQDSPETHSVATTGDTACHH